MKNLSIASAQNEQKTLNICIIKAKCQKEPRQVTLLSQLDASARKRQQGQVRSSGAKKKKRTPVGVQHIPHSHMLPLHVLMLLPPALKSFTLVFLNIL